MNTRSSTNSGYGTYYNHWSPTDDASRNTRYQRYDGSSYWVPRYESIYPEYNFGYDVMRPYRQKDIEDEVDSSKIDEFLAEFKVKS